jgi:predicted metal-dependent HD superfamily phosphohydrolase
MASMSRTSGQNMRSFRQTLTGPGAVQFLKGFLSRPRLYLTDIAHAEWDAAARANLARALRALEQGS